MNKAELIKAVASSAEISNADAARAVDSVFGAITDTLRSGSDVRLAGFGSFSVVERKATTGRNPPHRRIHFDRRLQAAEVQGRQDAQGRGQRLTGVPLGWRGRLAQLGERLVYTQEVGGSIPSPPTKRWLLQGREMQNFIRGGRASKRAIPSNLSRSQAT